MRDHDIPLMGIRMENADVQYLMQIVVDDIAADLLHIIAVFDQSVLF